ncbi:MAG: hypothetical protein Q9170_003490 [Blastenia crenularia]
MSIEASHLQRAESPALSGRSSPADPRKRIADDVPTKADKATRRYAAGIDRALTLFDNALQDWADYLPFLGRLLKALQLHPPGVADVPHKSLVAQRLSQCLNPALPSGVHQKALEVYTYIFSLIGKDGLGRDLPHYLPGLSPVLAYASLSTKPSLLALFDTFIVALDPLALRPALKAILLALLPGLEEESSEEFERTHGILRRLKKAVARSPSGEERLQDAAGDQFFWQCLFLATITSPSRRQGALAYLQRHLPHVGRPLRSGDLNGGQSEEHKQKLSYDVEAVTSPEPGLLVRCFAAGLSDPQVLIQRGFLDMLVTHLPLDSEVLHDKVTSADLITLAKAAVSVVSRREMSLNRRLWTWFLGSKEPSSDRKEASAAAENFNGNHDQDQDRGRQMMYFSQYGLNPLVQGIMTMLETDTTTAVEKARPFRIALALMDRWEIGSLVVPVLFVPAMTGVWRYQRLAPTPEEYEEVLRSASAFFDGVESGLIWDEINNKLLHATDMRVLDPQAFQDNLKLASFIVKNFDVQEEEMLIHHIPFLVISLLVKTRSLLVGQQDQQKLLSQDVFGHMLTLAEQLLDIVPGRAFDTRDPKYLGSLAYTNDALEAENRAFLTAVNEYYKVGQDGSRPKASTIDKVGPTKLLLPNALHLVVRELRLNSTSRFLESEISILGKVFQRAPIRELPGMNELLSDILEASQKLSAQENGFTELRGIGLTVSLLETVRMGLSNGSWLYDHRLRLILPNLLTAIWPFLSPASPKSNTEATRYIWKVHSLSIDKKLIESCISGLMAEKSPSCEEGKLDIEDARRFGTLWSQSNTNQGSHTRHSSLMPSKPSSVSTTTNAKDDTVLARPLLLLLDTLEDPMTEMFTFTAAWLQSPANVQVIVEYLQSKLHVTQNLGSSIPERAGLGGDMVDVDECLYYLRTMVNVIQWSPGEIWSRLLASPSESNGDHEHGVEEMLPDQAQSNKHGGVKTTMTVQMRLTRICLRYLGKDFEQENADLAKLTHLQQTAVSLLREIVLRSTSLVDLEAEAVSPILSALSWSVQKSNPPLQVSLIELVSVILGRRLEDSKHDHQETHRRILSGDHGSQKTMPRDRHDQEEILPLPAAPPPMLLDCLFEGLASVGSRPVLNHWVPFLNRCLPFYLSSLFQILIPLVDCLVKAVQSLFEDLRLSFLNEANQITAALEPVNTIIELLNGIEQVLARAHDRLTENEPTKNNTKTPEQPQGFFGNMVSGVFPSDVYKSRSAGANNRLTVLLCFKDAVNLCLRIWSWSNGSEASRHESILSSTFNHTPLRLKNRSRRILEHLFAVESLECLETLIYSWHESKTTPMPSTPLPVVLNLLHVLDGSRPRNTIPAIFNALYSRTNPSALDSDRKSTLTSQLLDTDIARFLVEYARSLEDDAMDEIWSDCMTFLKDVLTNPLPHRQTLPKLLEFTALLGIKVDNTNFGDNRKRRRELADLFLRQLTATFTTKPLSFSSESLPIVGQKLSNESHQALGAHSETAGDDIIAVLASIFRQLSKVLVDSDRITTASNITSVHVVAPTLRWKSFPRNVTSSFLDLLLSMTRVSEASKVWRKDVAEAFNDSKFFCEYTYALAASRWLPLLREWVKSDKDRMHELLSRIPSPTSAGIMFGVGASSARLEADRRAQLNLRRAATLLLAAPNDSFVVHMGSMQEKITELLNATAASSPSSATRAEVYIVLRALILKNQPIHLVSMWPSITMELHEALSSLYPSRSRDKYNMHCIVHACKLLDILIVAAPDDFQMRQWLFITDTIDAVYRPHDMEPRALVDDLVDDLDASAGTLQSTSINAPNASQVGSRKPLLTNQVLQGIPKEKLLDRAVRPFLRQLSINAFESTYSMTAFDWEAAYEYLLFDVFDDKSLTGPTNAAQGHGTVPARVFQRSAGNYLLTWTQNIFSAHVLFNLLRTFLLPAKPDTAEQEIALEKIMEKEYPASDPDSEHHKYEINMLLLFRLYNHKRFHKQIPHEMSQRTQESLTRLIVFTTTMPGHWEKHRESRSLFRVGREGYLTELAKYWRHLPNNEELMKYKDIWEHVSQRPLTWEGTKHHNNTMSSSILRPALRAFSRPATRPAQSARSFRTSSQLLETPSAALPLRKPVGAFRGG